MFVKCWYSHKFNSLELGEVSRDQTHVNSGDVVHRGQNFLNPWSPRYRYLISYQDWKDDWTYPGEEGRILHPLHPSRFHLLKSLPPRNQLFKISQLHYYYTEAVRPIA